MKWPTIELPDPANPKPGDKFPLRFRGDLLNLPLNVEVLHVDDRFVAWVRTDDGGPGIDPRADFARWARPLPSPEGKLYLRAEPLEKGGYHWWVPTNTSRYDGVFGSLDELVRQETPFLKEDGRKCRAGWAVQAAIETYVWVPSPEVWKSQGADQAI